MIELNRIYGNGFNNYFVTECGNIISKRNHRMIKIKTYFKSGYEYCKLWDNINRKYKHISIHITVAKAFIPNPNNLKTVNHKDRVKSHNYKNNLEWMSLIDNIHHANNQITNNKTCELWVDGQLIKSFISKSELCRYASDNYGVGRFALQKYGRSKNCVIIEKCND